MRAGLHGPLHREARAGLADFASWKSGRNDKLDFHRESRSWLLRLEALPVSSRWASWQQCFLVPWEKMGFELVGREENTTPIGESGRLTVPTVVPLSEQSHMGHTKAHQLQTQGAWDVLETEKVRSQV